MIVLGEFHIIQEVTKLSSDTTPSRQINPMLKNYSRSFISSFVNNLFISSHMFARTIIANLFANELLPRGLLHLSCQVSLPPVLRCSLTNGCITYAVFIGYCSDRQ